ncbi:MAG: sigma-70 family RNA polymerase sigma factor [Candidatus Omnitrophota bacterium]|jgi:RNA polymerase sigma factor (sigma-70 family)
MDFKVLLEKITPALRSIAHKHLLRGFYDQEDLYQEMCLYLWQKYSDGLPIGINESYVIKGCEFHILNFLRKGRPKAFLLSLDEPMSGSDIALMDTIADNRNVSFSGSDNMMTINDIKDKDLTNRERQVLSFLIKGYTVREIAQNMVISHVMVVKYKKRIVEKAKRKGYQMW